MTEPPVDPDPVSRLRDCLARAARTESFDATRCVLATATRDGRPSARFVLVKDVDARGLVFYTNVGSRKAQELQANPRAALCFHWSSIGEQVRAEGEVERVTDAEADAYFASRPRGNQIGAWASRQSEPVSSRATLDEAYAAIETRFAGQNIARPPFWTGFRVRPDRFEFWKNQDDRMHDRWVYTRHLTGWTVTRLFP